MLLVQKHSRGGNLLNVQYFTVLLGWTPCRPSPLPVDAPTLVDMYVRTLCSTPSSQKGGIERMITRKTLFALFLPFFFHHTKANWAMVQSHISQVLQKICLCSGTRNEIQNCSYFQSLMTQSTKKQKGTGCIWVFFSNTLDIITLLWSLPVFLHTHKAQIIPSIKK